HAELAEAGAVLLVADPGLEARLRSGAAVEVRTEAELTRQVADVGLGPAPQWVQSLDAQDLAYIVFTSGSTGRPKGAEITHAGLANLVNWHCRAFALTANDRTTLLASPAFDASVWEIWPTLAAGASLHIPDAATRMDAVLLRDWMVATGVTVSFAPTPLAEQMISLPWPKETKLRLLLTGGDVLRRHPPAGLPFALVNNYGVSEATVVATSGMVRPGKPTGDAKRPSIGQAIDGVELHILDAAQHSAPDGTAGELYIGGIGVARGYRNRPELTAERFVADPFSDRPGARLYRTGDRVCRLPDGEIAFLGRSDDQIQLNGIRIEPAEITAALDRHPGVAGSAVLAIEEREEKWLAAYIVPATGANATAAELRGYLRRSLPAAMIPARFLAIEALPVTANGKLDLAALRHAAAEPMREAPFRAAATPVEERLAAAVAETLGVAQLGMDDNFFDLGGHSLVAAQLAASVRACLGVSLPLRVIFEHPTVAEMGAVIEERILAAAPDEAPMAELAS
ncbi:MAG: AMP-binding protein, partial [Terriglobales bacterium]